MCVCASYVTAESGKEEPMETGAQEKAAQAEESSVQSGTNEVSDGHAREPQGTKRRGDDLGSGGVTKDRVDPTKVPDPDEPEAAEDLIAKVPLENEFEPVEDDSIVTLDSCRFGMKRNFYCCLFIPFSLLSLSSVTPSSLTLSLPSSFLFLCPFSHSFISPPPLHHQITVTSTLRSGRMG